MARKPLRRRDVLSFERRIYVSRKMRALVLKAPAPVESNPLVCEDIPVPEPGADEVLIQVLACGICRTDLHVVEGELPPKRSEERRVGKECRSRGSPQHEKKKIDTRKTKLQMRDMK